jgi:hypothetical protein
MLWQISRPAAARTTRRTEFTIVTGDGLFVTWRAAHTAPACHRTTSRAAGTRLPNARRRDEEAQGREEHPDRQAATEGGGPRRERARGDEDCDGDLDDAKHEKIGYRLINATADTVASKPSFRSAFKRRRCLLPADGFYESTS